MRKNKIFVKLLIVGLLYTLVFYGFYLFCNLFLYRELSIAIGIFLPSILSAAYVLDDKNNIHMGNFSNEEKMLITYIIQNFPRELSKDFEKQNFSSAKEWFINAAPMVNFYKSYKENINEIEAKYFSKHI